MTFTLYFSRISLVGQVLVEESILGWEELELEVVRDADGSLITVCFIENIAQVGQQRIRPLFCNNLLQPLLVQRLHIGDVSRFRIRHNGGRIGIHQHNFITQLFQSLAGQDGLEGIGAAGYAGPRPSGYLHYPSAADCRLNFL